MNDLTLLLCTDMDRTIIPNGAEPEDSEARPRLRQLVRRPDVQLVYVSGRDIGRVDEAIVEYALPQPDFVISDVGTCLHHRQGGEWCHHEDWSTHIAADWAGVMGPQLMSRVLPLLREVPGVTAQEDDRQSAYKASFYTPVEMNTGVLPVLASQLQAAGLRCNLVWSIDEPAQRGLLDVLPASASKLHALRYLQGWLGVADEQLVFAGDSGNDMEVLVSAVNSVLVGNATPQVRAAALERSRQNGTASSLYLAEGTMASGMNGNYAAGVIEGVLHFVPALHDFWRQERQDETEERMSNDS